MVLHLQYDTFDPYESKAPIAFSLEYYYAWQRILSTHVLNTIDIGLTRAGFHMKRQRFFEVACELGRTPNPHLSGVGRDSQGSTIF